jgi:hypothetical protein
MIALLTSANTIRKIRYLMMIICGHLRSLVVHYILHLSNMAKRYLGF